MNHNEKETIYANKKGELYIEFNGYTHLKGIFRLMMVSPQKEEIDPLWFDDQIKSEEIYAIGNIKKEVTVRY